DSFPRRRCTSMDRPVSLPPPREIHSDSRRQPRAAPRSAPSNQHPQTSPRTTVAPRRATLRTPQRVCYRRRSTDSNSITQRLIALRIKADYSSSSLAATLAVVARQVNLEVFMRSIATGFVICVSIWAAADDSKPGVPLVGPLSPKEELATFRVAKGFKVELVASEPDVIDPVAMAFDEDGRLFVAEMHGYPNKGVGTGQITSGKIKVLEPDENGAYTRCTTFAEGLRFPTSVMPWKGGLIVANAPDMLYLEDTDGDGKADRRRVLYSGFDLANIQQLLNS